jgi:hypothetical protein
MSMCSLAISGRGPRSPKLRRSVYTRLTRASRARSCRSSFSGTQRSSASSQATHSPCARRRPRGCGWPRCRTVRLADAPHAGVAPVPGVDEGAGVVRRAVVDDQNLVYRVGLGQRAGEGLVQIRGGVVCGDDDGDAGRGGHGLSLPCGRLSPPGAGADRGSKETGRRWCAARASDCSPVARASVGALSRRRGVDPRKARAGRPAGAPAASRTPAASARPRSRARASLLRLGRPARRIALGRGPAPPRSTTQSPSHQSVASSTGSGGATTSSGETWGPQPPHESRAERQRLRLRCTTGQHASTTPGIRR